MRMARDENRNTRRYAVGERFGAKHTRRLETDETADVFLAFHEDKRTLPGILQGSQPFNRTRRKLRVSKACTGEICYIANRELTRRFEKWDLPSKHFLPRGVKAPRERQIDQNFVDTPKLKF